MELAELKPFEDRELTLHMTDGETVRAKIIFVDSEYNDVIVDVLETTKPELYRNMPVKSCFTFPLKKIVRTSQPESSISLPRASNP